MRGPQCLFNPAAALRQVFISNALTFDKAGRLLPAAAIPSQQSATCSPPRRPFSTQQVAQRKFSRFDTGAGNGNTNATRVMRDHDIIYPWVQMRQEDGKLGEPQRTNAILKTLNKDKYSLVLIAPPRKDAHSKGPQYPIVRVVDKAAEAKVTVEKKETKTVLKEKEMELNWAIAPHDLETMMTRLVKFLDKGFRVRVTIANPKKKSKRRATDDEAKRVFKRVKELIESMAGATEYKPMEGEVKEMVVFHLQGTKKDPDSPPAETERKGVAEKVEDIEAKREEPEAGSQ